MPRPENAAETGSPASIVAHAHCDDCGCAVSDWIIAPDNSRLCFACADAWEEFGFAEAVRA